MTCILKRNRVKSPRLYTAPSLPLQLSHGLLLSSSHCDCAHWQSLIFVPALGSTPACFSLYCSNILPVPYWIECFSIYCFGNSSYGSSCLGQKLFLLKLMRPLQGRSVFELGVLVKDTQVRSFLQIHYSSVRSHAHSCVRLGPYFTAACPITGMIK